MDRLIERTAEVEDRHFWFHGLRRHARAELARAVGAHRPGLIVDCGAGTGRNLDWLGEFGPAMGLELTDAGVRFGRRLGRRMIRGDILHMPFAAGVADVATCFDVLYAFDLADGRRLVREVRRIVRPGGVALFNVAALRVLRGAHSAWTHERHRYGRAELRQLLESEGWHVERLTFTNLSLFPVALGLRWMERVTGRASSGAYLSVPPAPINSMFDAALRLEAAWLRVGALPVGTSLLAVVRNPA
jgi:SAM-dependent methyltransferase